MESGMCNKIMILTKDCLCLENKNLDMEGHTKVIMQVPQSPLKRKTRKE